MEEGDGTEPYILLTGTKIQGGSDGTPPVIPIRLQDPFWRTGCPRCIHHRAGVIKICMVPRGIGELVSRKQEGKTDALHLKGVCLLCKVLVVDDVCEGHIPYLEGQFSSAEPMIQHHGSHTELLHGVDRDDGFNAVFDHEADEGRLRAVQQPIQALSRLLCLMIELTESEAAFTGTHGRTIRRQKGTLLQPIGQHFCGHGTFSILLIVQ